MPCRLVWCISYRMSSIAVTIGVAYNYFYFLYETCMITGKSYKSYNIAGRLPENSRNSFVDLQSQKNSEKDRPKKFGFSFKADMLYFDYKSV